MTTILRSLCAVLLALVTIWPAAAQDYRDSAGKPVTGFVPTDPLPPYGGGTGALGGPTNPLHTTGASGPSGYAPVSPGQYNLAITSSTALTVPSSATYAVVCAATANANYTTDGTTTPTASVGMALPVGACVPLSGTAVLADFLAISAAGTLNVSYYK
jgi:hypothetical protein